MSSNRLKLNSEKKQFIWSGSARQLQKVTVDSITLAGNTLSVHSSINNLGVLIDGRLSMRDHVERMCRSSYYQLRQLRVIRNFLSTKTCAALVHAFVTSRLDYCNSLLAGINKELLNKLESVLHSAARLAMGKRKFDPRSPKTCEISSTGSQFAKGSTSNSASSSSSVFAAMLRSSVRPTWSNQCRRLPTNKMSEAIGLPPAVTSCHEHEQ